MDDFFQYTIKQPDGFGNKAILFIRQKCSNIDEADKHHVHQHIATDEGE
jgi:hypothetical protein